jgi:hypothetical protein
MQALDAVPRIAQQQRGNGGIHAARESDDGQGIGRHAGILAAAF